MSPFAFLKLKLGSIGWYSDTARKKKLYFVMAMFLILPILFIPAKVDNDTWFMLNHGRYLVEHGFTSIEPFTVHEGLTFSFEKWLTCIFFWAVYSIGGAKAIYLLVVGIGMTVIACFYKLCMILSDGNYVTSCITTTIALAPTFIGFMVSRPQIFGYLFMLIELICLEKYVRTKNWKFLIPLPFISILWMQFHSTMWLICFIMALPYLIEAKFFKVKCLTVTEYKKKPILLAMIGMFAGGFINPYGARSVFYLIESMKNNELSKVGIMELSKTSMSSILLFGLVLAGHIIFFWFKRRDMPVRYALLMIGTFIMGAYALRNVAFYSIVGGAVLAWEYKDMQIPEKWTKHGLDILVVGIPIVGLSAVLSTVSPSSSVGYFTNLYDGTVCKKAVDALYDYTTKKGQDPEDLKVFTSFNDGAYAEFKGFKCYMDPRAEVFIKEINKKKDVLGEYIEFLTNQFDYNELQSRYDFDYWVADKSYAYTLYMQNDDNCKNIYEDDNCIIFKIADAAK